MADEIEIIANALRMTGIAFDYLMTSTEEVTISGMPRLLSTCHPFLC
jgi:hypothetical protein